MRNPPVSLVCAERSAAVCVFLAETVAPEITAPLASVMVPVIAAFCATIDFEAKKESARTKSRRTDSFFMNESPRTKRKAGRPPRRKPYLLSAFPISTAPHAPVRDVGLRGRGQIVDPKKQPRAIFLLRGPTERVRSVALVGSLLALRCPQDIFFTVVTYELSPYSSYACGGIGRSHSGDIWKKFPFQDYRMRQLRKHVGHWQESAYVERRRDIA